MPSSLCALTLQHRPRSVEGGSSSPKLLPFCSWDLEQDTHVHFPAPLQQGLQHGAAGSSVRGSVLSSLALFLWEETWSQLSLSAVYFNEWPLWEIFIINLCPIIFTVNLLFSQRWVSFLQGDRKVNCSVRCSLGKITSRNISEDGNRSPRCVIHHLSNSCYWDSQCWMPASSHHLPKVYHPSVWVGRTSKKSSLLQPKFKAQPISSHHY